MAVVRGVRIALRKDMSPGVMAVVRDRLESVSLTSSGLEPVIVKRVARLGTVYAGGFSERGLRYGGELFVLLVSSADSYLLKLKPSTKTLGRGHVQQQVQMRMERMRVVVIREGEIERKQIVENTTCQGEYFHSTRYY